jgi:hypothetical protein
MKRRTYFVIVIDDVPVPAGTMINGQPAPEGARLDAVPLAPPFHSKRQCRKAFATIVQRHPTARRMRWTSLCRQAYRPPTTYRTARQQGGAA